VIRAGAIAALALPALSAGAAQAQTAPSEIAMAPTAPIPLFKAVCVDGEARLSKKWAKQTSFSALPVDARRALGQTGTGGIAPEPSEYDVPNPIFQIGDGDEYLILPTESGAKMAETCAVMWKGNDYAAATKLVASVSGSITVVTAAAYNGWTILKSVAPVPASPPDPQSGVR
jgi:hypothetical protein